MHCSETPRSWVFDTDLSFVVGLGEFRFARKRNVFQSREIVAHSPLSHYGLSFPAFTRSGVRIRRNLCIREGVRIRTRCVYALPLA